MVYLIDKRDCMSEIKTDFIEKVIDIMKNNELSEIELEKENCSIYIKADNNEYEAELISKKKNEAKTENSIMIRHSSKIKDKILQ